jgi:hypothetical protein
MWDNKEGYLLIQMDELEGEMEEEMVEIVLMEVV